MTFQPDQGTFPQVCPYLGLADDADSHATYSTEAHRCYKLPRPTKIALGHQDTYCLGENHTSCPIFQGEGVPATQQPAPGAAPAATGAAAAGAAGAVAAGAAAAGTPPASPATPAAPRTDVFATNQQPAGQQPPTRPPAAPRSTTSGSSSGSGGGFTPKKSGITMPMATIGLFAIALGVIALVLLVLNCTGGDGDDELTPQDSLATSQAQTEEAAGGGTEEPTQAPGETATAGPTSEEPSPTTPGGGTEYTVQAGDTCAAIAESFGITVDELVAANDMTVDDCPNLQVGQVLIIPPPGG